MFSWGRTVTMVDPAQALPGREGATYDVPTTHAVLGTALAGPWPAGTEVLSLAMGCFWGAERLLWQTPGVVTTAAGYQGGYTPNPTYEEVCTGRTGHTETVLVAYDPGVVSASELLVTFWEQHDPTQGMRQGNDVGSQYRSALYWTTPAQEEAVHATYDAFTRALARAGRDRPITTELLPAGGDRRSDAGVAGPFWYAEGYHQQYLHKNPGGYCPVHATGVRCDPA